MSRGVLTIILIVLVLAITGVGLALFWQPDILNRNTANENANTTVNTNNTNTATETSPISGDLGYKADVINEKEVNQTVTYRDKEVPIERVEITTGFDYAGPVEEGKKLVLVHFTKDVFTFHTTVEEWLGQEIQLVDKDGNATPYYSASFGPTAPGEPRYISFLVDEGASGFSLRFVREGEDRSVDLGI